MRRIHLKPPDDKKWKRWLKDCEKETKILHNAINQGEDPTFNQSLYKRRKE